MPSVGETITLPAAGEAHRTRVEIAVAGLGGHPLPHAYGPDSTLVSAVNVPIVEGAWSADLIPNASIEPSGTVYRVLVSTPVGDSWRQSRRFISVPDEAGPFTVQALEVDPPTPITGGGIDGGSA